MIINTADRAVAYAVNHGFSTAPHSMLEIDLPADELDRLKTMADGVYSPVSSSGRYIIEGTLGQKRWAIYAGEDKGARLIVRGKDFGVITGIETNLSACTHIIHCEKGDYEL